MNKPPMFIKLWFCRPGSKFRLWLPLFIFLPLLLVIILLIAPLLLIAALVLWSFGWGKVFLLFIPVLIGIIWALRGLEIDINDKEQRVFISIK